MMHLRLERRSSTPAWFSLALPLAALAATLILCSGLVALAGANVLDAYARIISGFSRAEQEALFFANAERIFRI